jgi:hypothetical protein
MNQAVIESFHTRAVRPVELFSKEFFSSSPSRESISRGLEADSRDLGEKNIFCVPSSFGSETGGDKAIMPPMFVSLTNLNLMTHSSLNLH